MTGEVAQTEAFPRGEELERKMAKAYRVYQANVRAADEGIYTLTMGARSGVPEGRLLEIAVDLLHKCQYGTEEKGA